MAKTHTSTEVKRRYNEKVYSMLHYQMPKDLVARFREKCTVTGISQASVIREAIERFLEEPMDEIKFDPDEDTGEE